MQWPSWALFKPPDLIGLRLQRNLEVIENSLRELKTKLDYEQNKQKTYSKDLKIAETRCHILHPFAQPLLISRL